jgi:predicted nucleic acid-binding protein
VTRLLIDTSVLSKWFHSEGESELPQARALRSAHAAGALDAHVLDLAAYEAGPSAACRRPGRVPDGDRLPPHAVADLSQLGSSTWPQASVG